MDKREYKIRSEEILALIEKRDFVKAVTIADTIDWTRVQGTTMLCRISDLYKVNRKYKESKEILLLANERHPGSRKIVYSLCELSIKLGEVVSAIEYYKEFIRLAPRDSSKFILQYKLYVAQEVGLDERIVVLEELKKKDYREKWGYELAYLYHKVGMVTSCVEACDELILWFDEGKYVKKAMELKMLHKPLTPAQQYKYDLAEGLEQEAVNHNKEVVEKVEEEPEQFYDEPDKPEIPVNEEKTEDIEVPIVDISQYNTINLQKELAEMYPKEEESQSTEYAADIQQMSIDELILEWERVKSENQEKRENDVKNRIHEHTDNMFTEFEAKVRDDILKKLQEERNVEDKKEEILEDIEVEDLPEVEELEEILDEDFEQELEVETIEVSVQDLEAESIENPEAELEAEPIEELEPELEAEVIEELELEAEPIEELRLELEIAPIEELVQESEVEVPEESVQEQEEVPQVDDMNRDLSEREKALFSSYIQTKSGKTKLLTGLNHIQMYASMGNVIVTGDSNAGADIYAQNLMKQVQETTKEFSGKIAKVKGNSLNAKDIRLVIQKLKGGSLIIQKASAMHDATIVKLLEALEQSEDCIVVVLEDTRTAIGAMKVKYPVIEDMFPAYFEIEELGNDALVAYGKKYAMNLEYAIDELGLLALHTRIESIQTIDHKVTVADVREIVDEAIESADKKSMAHLMDVILHNRYDDQDMIILREKDFNL